MAATGHAVWPRRLAAPSGIRVAACVPPTWPAARGLGRACRRAQPNASVAPRPRSLSSVAQPVSGRAVAPTLRQGTTHEAARGNSDCDPVATDRSSPVDAHRRRSPVAQTRSPSSQRPPTPELSLPRPRASASCRLRRRRVRYPASGTLCPRSRGHPALRRTKQRRALEREPLFRHR